MKTSTKNKLYDRVHRIWVGSCMGVTVVCTAFVAYELVNYFLYVRPVKKEIEEQFKRDLLKEGILRDTAPITQS